MEKRSFSREVQKDPDPPHLNLFITEKKHATKNKNAFFCFYILKRFIRKVMALHAPLEKMIFYAFSVKVSNLPKTKYSIRANFVLTWKL